MKTVLVTGFEPFGGDRRNPSQEIAQALHGSSIAGRRVVGAVLPCVFGASIVDLRNLLRVHHPELVMCLGMANGRTHITPERVALNLNDAPIPDNGGQQPVDVAIVRGGPAAYWSTLPVKAIVATLRHRGVPASVSHTAGTFVCNHVFYGLMHALRWQRTIRGGFIHVPGIETSSTNAAGLSLSAMTDAIALAIETSLKHRRDIRRASGALA